MILKYETTTKAEAMLVNALQRLLNGAPTRIKAEGRLTLNRINKEAGLGNSYIHKFKDFVNYAKPIIAEYNLNREKAILTGLDIEVNTPLSELENLKAKLKGAEALKAKYRTERDNAVAARKILEQKNSELMFRAYDLQDELLQHKQTITPFTGKPK
ncbi:hypothetical protein [Paraglaciecola polaris]|uniref:Uncharacterized protein n=1 Tax=Paraglaciecola polaris LMG 21857 TaxID=1129793 RepID=K6ZTI5_9ALTE|nr:hypothetical protein [Paraglaciecola polaris]GAC33592.1 hypothetical protein GPLA_2698 [Paraglaciecola polaris LMG 21857]|tara:strand:+ start:1698 stop:2168 length:471 start_codon:yes stop_codon:yes gene_type:complete